MLPRLTPLLVLGLALLGVAACGGDGGEDEYGDELPRLNERIVSLGEEVGDVIEGASESTDEELADDFGDFATELGEVRQDLDELEPPEDLADEQDELSAALRDARGSLDDIADAAERSDPDAAREATIELIQQSEDLREARQALVRGVREQD